MPESYEIDVDRRLITCRVWGTFTSAELREHYRRMFIDPRFDPTFIQLGDLREVTDFAVDSETIAQTAAGASFVPGTRRAMVANPGLGYGLARMFAAYSASAGQDIEVFEQVPRAREWLGLDDDPTAGQT